MEECETNPLFLKYIEFAAQIIHEKGYTLNRINIFINSLSYLSIGDGPVAFPVSNIQKLVKVKGGKFLLIKIKINFDIFIPYQGIIKIE